MKPVGAAAPWHKKGRAPREARGLKQIVVINQRRWGRVEMVKVFLSRGADPVEAEAEPWATPRAWAVKMHWPEIVELL